VATSLGDLFDKILPGVQFIKWQEEAVAEVLANRIKLRHANAANRAKNTWAVIGQELGGDEKQARKLFSYLFAYVTNGPRDVITICNLARENKPEGHLGRADIDTIAARYARDKISLLHSEYGNIYKGLSTFVTNALTGAAMEMQGIDLARLIDERTKVRREGGESFRGQDWFEDSGPEMLVEVLFQVGVIGVVEGEGRAVYAIERENFSQQKLLSATLRIHDAYAPALVRGPNVS
jgi:hypothetical protein